MSRQKNETYGSGHALGPIDALICPCLVTTLVPFLFDVSSPWLSPAESIAPQNCKKVPEGNDAQGFFLPYFKQR